MRCQSILLCYLVWLIAGCTQADTSAEQIIGYWACEAGDCPDEELQFAMENGVPLYHSWLHQRPAAANGSWYLNGSHLQITCCAGLQYDYEIVHLGHTRMVLRDTVSHETATFKRLNLE